MILATSLLDKATYPTPAFKRLYHLRWGVEEEYKREKCRVEIENFSGLTAQVGLQDSFAKRFMVNLTAVMTGVAQAIADRLHQARRYRSQVNFANALSKMKNHLIGLILDRWPPALLTELITVMALTTEPVRPDRAYPRTIRPRKLHGFFPNYKRTR